MTWGKWLVFYEVVRSGGNKDGQFWQHFDRLNPRMRTCLCCRCDAAPRISRASCAYPMTWHRLSSGESRTCTRTLWHARNMSVLASLWWCRAASITVDGTPARLFNRVQFQWNNSAYHPKKPGFAREYWFMCARWACLHYCSRCTRTTDLASTGHLPTQSINLGSIMRRRNSCCSG